MKIVDTQMIMCINTHKMKWRMSRRVSTIWRHSNTFFNAKHFSFYVCVRACMYESRSRYMLHVSVLLHINKTNEMKEGKQSKKRITTAHNAF